MKPFKVTSETQETWNVANSWWSRNILKVPNWSWDLTRIAKFFATLLFVVWAICFKVVVINELRKYFFWSSDHYDVEVSWQIMSLWLKIGIGVSLNILVPKVDYRRYKAQLMGKVKGLLGKSPPTQQADQK